MSNSLRDQLVKAGLATNEQAKKAEREKRAEAQARRQGGKGKKKGKAKGQAEAKAVDPARERARKRQAQKAARDRELAEERNAKAAAKALRAEIKDIVRQNDRRKSKSEDSDVAYQFVHGKKIKRVYVPPSQRDELIKGQLVIVNDDGTYHFVDKAIAEQIKKRDPKRIIVANADQADADRPKEENADDEYYAQFEVPDDLDW